MRNRCAHMDQMRWECIDIFEMDSLLDAETFDVALDKGTLDALLTVKHDPWSPPQSLLMKIKLYMEQISKVLMPNGVFIHITFAQPHFRKQFLESCFEVSVHTLGGSDSFDYYIYVCKKLLK